MKKIPKKLLDSKYRKLMWRNAERIVKQLSKLIPIFEAYVLGSFTTKKSRPADVDFILFMKTPEKNKKLKWSVDLTLVPDNDYGKFVLEDADKWVKEKYGLDKSVMIKLK
ncbi:MAG: hypothetical protein A3I07_03455 [Candidatus Doudnabacteria bacterium RIFCSPLOWO2_02_FULL_42_9]|uniref:Polymerase nucleotidyl transferase domain-containing protein n=1 Tax=Candidatus Doudnabacteria bacterium RIFCSPHIGHO2_01_FULL_41_86 TaxID=1817821 RepID=A0A1F5N8A5_9BACT|nr:MAG: hypothetical protein A2717_04620 [Candidatus Doudnabacteria bacterium RIFCSPHIGHO2_01_FULL_41_86]OGE75896.1 MAG: hypothetical protein A3K07_04215 [Candidatus Doudnabacteria bacterium RIFCSPHIGHO2_01_43_10]OGE86270.1 MAG: hypothetical protein A3E28_03975 [Candidatus Doudnabacteria bacterium RIFCSPHIGHO2_12_FULL_42_22]OGE87118.1 MAG: hypothetical protein A3C49_03640 [Candidatus Doudnabacteria bacterium RIFCSPHIGHO2_02_FULL_42_25]OGE92258.1 MAG: hypothetical protein A2895_04325 [Candidatus